MSRKRAHAQDEAQSIIDSGETDIVTAVETWSDDDLYDWLEAWGYEWDSAEGWVKVDQDDDA